MTREFTEPGEDESIAGRIQNFVGSHWTAIFWISSFVVIMTIVEYHEYMGYDVTTSYLIGGAAWAVMFVLGYVIEKKTEAKKVV